MKSKSLRTVCVMVIDSNILKWILAGKQRSMLNYTGLALPGKVIDPVNHHRLQINERLASLLCHVQQGISQKSIFSS